MRLNATTALILVVPVVLAISGCGSSISFTAATVIDERGVVVRTTQLASSGSASFDDLKYRYDLLPGGEWSESEEMVSPALPNTRPRRVYNRDYTLARRLGRRDDIASDFRRRADGSDEAAYNRILIRTRRLWFVDLYDYEETFSDIPTIESMTAAARAGYDTLVDVVVEEIVALGIAGLDRNEVRERFDSRFAPTLEAFVVLLEERCAAPSAPAIDDCLEGMEQEPELQPLVTMLNDDEALLYELVDLFPAPENVTKQEWMISFELDVLNDAENRLADYAEEDWLESFGTAFFGAHGLALFDRYPFDVSLRMPGLVVSTNAHTREAGELRWAFDHEAFILNDLTLDASSRIVHRNRIVAAAALSPFLPIAWLGFARSHRRRSREA